MDALTVLYNHLQKVKDEKFNVEDIEHYSLSLSVSSSRFQVFILDTRTNLSLLLEDFEYTEALSSSELISALEKIYDEHHLLKAGFWSNIKIAVKNQQFALVPTSLFQKNRLSSYLKLNCSFDDNDRFHYYKHINADCTTVFAANKGIFDFFESIYSNISLHFLHQSSVFIEGILNYDDHTHLPSMFLSYDEASLQVMVTEDNKLKLYNRFAVKEPEAILKFVMHVMNEMNLDQNNTKVLVWGDLDTQSEIFQILYRYIRNISFGNRPGYLRCGYVFDVVSDHQYFDLLSTHPCD